MMERLLKDKLGETHNVESAGVLDVAKNHKPANDKSIAAISSMGFDLSDHRSRYIGDVSLGKFDHILCVGQEEADIVCQLTGKGGVIVTVLDISNPWEQPQEAYDECLKTIVIATEAWLESL